jgi:hypothetical protein
MRQLTVGVGLVGGVRVPERGDDIAERGHQGTHLVSGELLLGWRGVVEGSLGGETLGLDFSDPLADEGTCGSRP